MASSDNERERRRGSTCWLISCIEPFETVCFSVGAGADRWSLLGASSAMAGSVDIIFLLAVRGGEQESTGLSHPESVMFGQVRRRRVPSVVTPLYMGAIARRRCVDDCQAKPDLAGLTKTAAWQSALLSPINHIHSALVGCAVQRTCAHSVATSRKLWFRWC